MAASKVAVVFVLTIILNFANAQKSPTISYISQSQIKDIGGTVELSCSVQDTGHYSVIWKKLDEEPISIGSSLVLPDSRFSLRYDPTSSTYELQIKDIQETDAGTYSCQILVSPSNKVSSQVEVQVRRPPVISDNSTRSVVASEGQAIDLECYADGYPVPNITWRRQYNAILPTGGSIYEGNQLKIKSIKKEDRGTYYCVAENGIGRGRKRSIAVEVEFKPVVTVPEPRLGQALQYNMDLGCHVEAYPPAAITWEKNETSLSTNQHYKISHFSVSDELIDTILRVNITEKSLYGQYKCKAANKLGEAEGVVELFESVTPADPK